MLWKKRVYVCKSILSFDSIDVDVEKIYKYRAGDFGVIKIEGSINY